MAERNTSFLWMMRAVYLGLCIFVIFLHLLPLDTQPRAWAGPDLMLALTFAWTLRRAEYVPPLLVAAIFQIVRFFTRTDTSVPGFSV